ncbi:uncharacterized protein LOC110988452 [Acanthaster planci]|uniref:Uncharacterized protein LOC110988452 n=1 Tax=Acanthaster planci TaxID=133434 RepID=A0A8B7ZVT6_ACAPL|nr:uncharacterized protein LOC110988452 [Acanthaster planci]
MARTNLVYLLLVTTALFTAEAARNSARITAPGSVTVRRGEPLLLSCNVTFQTVDVRTVRWERMQKDASRTPAVYGEIDVSGGCVLLTANLSCMAVNTTDNRGIVRYERGTSNNAWLTLTISESQLEDSTDFQCVFHVNGSRNEANIQVTVNFFPNTSYPVCFVSSYLTYPTPSILTCLSETARPNISLQWTTSVDAPDIPLEGRVETAGGQVVSKLHLNSSWTYKSFTCHLTSGAFPNMERQCSVDIGPVLASTIDSSSATIQDRQPISTDALRPTVYPTSSNKPDTKSRLSSTLIIVVSAGVVSVIIILLAIIVCLVSKRRKSRSSEQGKTTLHLSIPALAGDDAGGHIYHTIDGPSTNGGGEDRDASQIRDFRPTGLPLSATSSSATASKLLPSYAVLDPDKPVYAAVQKKAASSHDARRNPNDMKRSCQENPHAVGEASSEAVNFHTVDGLEHRLDGSSENGECTTDFVDNILYVSSPDDALGHE